MPARGFGGKIPEDVKRVIVRMLAEYVKSPDILYFLEEEYKGKVKVTKQALQHYNPDTHQGRDLDAGLIAYFRECRAKYNANLDAIPANSPAWKQWERTRLYHANPKNPVLQSQLLDAMDKAASGGFSNQVQHAGHDGGLVEVVVLTVEQQLQKLATLKEQVRARQDASASVDAGGD